jgi:glycosyltransferase involved in cell wall biosynthesis
MKVSVVIPAQDEQQTLGRVLKEVKHLQPHEIIVVVNGSKDGTAKIAESFGCRVIYFEQSLGNDIGRAIGAKHATGDILLFLDGDIIIPHDELVPFVHAIQEGYDIALNDLSWLASLNIRPHYTTACKIAVNVYLRQSNLSLNSLIAVPHAIKREAIQKLGWEHLGDPILAQAMAVKLGLRITAPSSVDVINTNKIRSVHRELDPKSYYPKTTSRIIGDHLRAIHYLTNMFGSRAGFSDENRSRKLPNNLIPANSSTKRKAKYSVIITVSEETNMISSVIEQVKLAGVDEIILVANKAAKGTIATAKLEGAVVMEYQKDFNHNVARAVGAMHATADICLFIDSDHVILAKDLKPFLQAVEKGVDIALNNLQVLLDTYKATDFVSIGQYFVNMAVNRPDLLNNCLTVVPYALHKKVIKTIGYEALIVPSLAQMKAILAGFKVEAVHQVKAIVDQKSKLTNKQVRVSEGILSKPINEFEQILGDQIEALAYLLQQTDERGGFTDGGRRREFLQ